MKKIDILILFFLVILAPIGCSTGAKALPDGFKPRSPITFSTNTLRDREQWSTDTLEKLKVYVGKSKEELRKDFGEPRSIKYDIPCKEGLCEEAWRYWYSRGIPFVIEESWAYNFYINNGIVAYVNID
ncbi:MAG: hypothetical protein WCX16_04230 [Candidatus Omnitrophota bacterium]